MSCVAHLEGPHALRTVMMWTIFFAAHEERVVMMVHAHHCPSCWRSLGETIDHLLELSPREFRRQLSLDISLRLHVQGLPPKAPKESQALS